MKKVFLLRSLSELKEDYSVRITAISCLFPVPERNFTKPRRRQKYRAVTEAEDGTFPWLTGMFYLNESHVY